MTRCPPQPFHVIAASALALSFCAPLLAADCAAVGPFEPTCGFQRPEDLELMPDGHALLISEYGTLGGAEPGRLKLWKPDAPARVLYPADNADGTPDWGAADCPGAPGLAFAPHGIHLGPAAGENRVFAVNHGQREAVEIFELTAGDDGNAAALHWRGCVPAPEGVWLNDVAGLPGGGFAVTHMVTKGTHEEDLFAAEAARNPIGYALEWSPAGGWLRLPGTDGSLPNGIEVSDDGTVLYINEYFGDRTYALERSSGKRLWSTAVDGPDNLGWSADGRLLAASHHGNLREIFACNALPTTPCAMRYSVVAIDPVSGNRVTVLEGGPHPLGAATVATEFDGRLYMGSFVGDRIVSAPSGSGVQH